MQDDSDLLRLIVAVVVVVAVGFPVMVSLTGLAADYDTRTRAVETQTGLLGGQYGQLWGANITGVSVEQSLGDAASLDGDASVTLPDEPDTSGDWTLATLARVNNTTGTRTVYADRERILLYNGSTDEWVGAHYSYTTGDTHVVRLAATDEANATPLFLTLNSTGHLVLEEGTSSSASADTADAAFSGELAGDNLNGTLDETRVFDDELTGAEKQQYVDRPTAPLDSENRLRVMYDSQDKTPRTLLAFYGPGDATATGVRLVAGAQGEPTEAGVDYERNGRRIGVLNGGSLDGAPVFYATWTANFSGLSEAAKTVVDTLPLLFGLLLIVVVANRVRREMA